MKQKTRNKAIKKDLQVIFRMWNFKKELRILFYIAIIIGNTNISYSTFLNSYVMEKITSVCMKFSMGELWVSIIKVSILFLGALVMYPVSYGVIYTLGAKISGELKKKLFYHVENMSVSYISNASSGDIASRLTADFRNAVELCGYSVLGYGNLISLIFTVAAICVIILYKNFSLGIISILLNMVSLLIISSMRRPLQIKERRVKEVTSEASQEIVNALSGTIVSRMFGLDEYLTRKYGAKSEDIFKYNVSIIHKKSTMFLLTDIQSFISFAGIVLIGLLLSVKGFVDIPTVVFISTMQMSLTQIVTQIGQKFADMPKYIVAASRIFEILDTPVEQQRENIAEPDMQTDWVISMEDVSFQYQSSEIPIFEKLNLKVCNGEKIAIVGASGGGKSSLLKLLLEFESKNSGDIYIFGNKIENYSQKTIRSFYSYVPQNCYLFDTTIEENVYMGKPDASPEEVEKAIENAYLKDFIHSLPDGIKTQVGEHGSKLSGGQRQRVAIARAFLKNAPIILLDEATSALDSQSENEVQKALDSLLEGRTSIIVAHRLSTIQNSDRILVFERGKCIEEGNHDTLIENGGRYAQLYEMQFL